MGGKERQGGKEWGDREGGRRRARREGKRDKETQLYTDNADGRNWYPEISCRPSVCIKKVTEKVGQFYGDSFNLHTMTGHFFKRKKQSS